jgi:hypothetical protein
MNEFVKQGFFLKLAEYAPGIKQKGLMHEIREVEKPEFWEYVLQKHLAKKRGKHYDLRLGDPETGHGHSFALPGKLPKPGEYIDIPRTETHSLDYFDYEGKIPQGYGAGTVSTEDRGKVEIYKTSPGRISFLKHKGSDTERFTLVGDPDSSKWRLLNHTPTRKKYNLPTKKIPVKEMKKPVWGEGYTMTPKLSGAHSVVDLPGSGKLVNVYSYRVSKKHPGLPIDHTFKFKDYYKNRVPAGLGGTRIRGEIVGYKPSGEIKLIAEQELGGILNSSPLKSRQKQKDLNAKLMIYLYNIDKYRGRDVSNKSPEEKDRLLKEVASKLPKNTFKLVVPVKDSIKQGELYRAIKEKQHHLTDEGVVIRDETTGKLWKLKNRPDFDVYVRDIYQAKDVRGNLKNEAGGFKYSYSPNGEIIGNVGTGLKNYERLDMWQSPEKYIGRVAKVTSAKKTKATGALSQPSFTGDWHIEKGRQDG